MDSITPEEIDNPITFENDQACLQMLNELACDPQFEAHELELFQKCISVIISDDEAPLEFDLCDLLELSTLSETHLNQSDNIRACADYLSTIINYQFNIPDDPTLMATL